MCTTSNFLTKTQTSLRFSENQLVAMTCLLRQNDWPSISKQTGFHCPSLQLSSNDHDFTHVTLSSEDGQQSDLEEGDLDLLIKTETSISQKIVIIDKQYCKVNICVCQLISLNPNQSTALYVKVSLWGFRNLEKKMHK